MPQELLSIPTSYLLVGIYRLAMDPTIWKPIWTDCKSGLRKGLLISGLLSTLSYPFTRLWVRFFMKQSSILSYSDEASFLKIPIATFTTISLVAGQASWIIQFVLKRNLKKARSKAYEMTVRSRAKDQNFWIGYVEEWEHPPLDKARRKLSKRKWYNAISGPIFRLMVLKLFLLPLHFVPFLNTIVASFLSSLTLAETLLEPYFASKKMTQMEQALFLVERQNELRWLGFFGSILERTPFLGIIFSISNRIAIAMFAHDLEKRQHLIKDGKLSRKPGVYISRTEAIELDLPSNAIGNFPKKHTFQQTFDGKKSN
ncbi:hypothetical protein O181_038813 [Austropuccinia psidii MF-1]|uniref:Uncharacterized protein n=1 Tax=Austropuccinia psidii MF-1 TaxID=1389203 RepID=A0A9Q3DC51_9BASI|nr:hypothetical protein [Austropuccinia psidii MF-1]